MRKNSFIRRFFIANNLLLLLLFCILLLLPQIPVKHQLTGYHLLLLAAMFASIFSIQKGEREIYLYIAVALSAVLAVVELFSLPLLGLFFRAAFVFIFVVTVARLIRQTARARKVTERVIVDSISGYLLVGVVYSLLVKLITQLNFSAIKIPGTPEPMNTAPDVGDLIYFTFITYTSTGYGDILPVSPAARSLAVFIAISGQIYIAIIISLLVGKFAGTDFKEA